MANTYEQKTIRDSLLGMVADHLGKGQINCGLTQQVGCELVALLAGYREEDRRLYPQVYLIGPSSSDLIRVLAPGIPILPIGSVEDEFGGPRKAAATSLKMCASLAIDGWCIFIRRVDGGFEYGLIRPSAETYSAGPEETLATSNLSVALLRHSAESTVEITNSVGGQLEISLTTAPSAKNAMSEQIFKFSKVASSDVSPEDRERATRYLMRLLTDFLRGSHGTLLAVVPCEAVLDNEKFGDGIVLSDAIPLVQTMLTALKEQTAADASLLRAHESLLRGMIESDGITILGSDGSIRAFRVFVHKPDETAEGPREKTAGGARSRAFDILRSYVGAILDAALFRSQDGRTEVVVKAE